MRSLQNSFRFGSPQPKRSGVLDHLIVLLADQVPVDRLQARKEIEPEQVRKGEGHLAFYMDKSSLIVADFVSGWRFLVYRKEVRPKAL